MLMSSPHNVPMHSDVPVICQVVAWAPVDGMFLYTALVI